MSEFRHPETREGEVFLSNVTYCSEWVEDEFNDINWKTKRLGCVAYTKTGVQLSREEHPNTFPLFVQKDELRRAGVEVEEN